MVEKYWHQISNLGVYEGMRPQLREGTRILNRVIFFIGLLVSLQLISAIFAGFDKYSGSIVVSYLVITPILLYGNYKQRYNAVRLAAIVIGVLFVTALAILSGGKWGAEYYIFDYALGTAMVYHKKHHIKPLLLFEITCFFFAKLAPQHLAPISELAHEHTFCMVNIVFAFAFIAMGLLLFKDENLRYRKDIETKNAELEQQKEEIVVQRDMIKESKEELEEKNRDLTASITYAQRIQAAILPQHFEVLPDHFLMFRPRDVVSGDFYWFATVPAPLPDDPENKKLVVTAVDCTGHGVPGAFMSMLGSSLLEQIVEDRQISSPDVILGEMHKGIRHALKQEETENRDGMDMAVCTIDLARRKLEFAGAKNPLYYVQNGEMKVIKGDKSPIGGLQLEKERKFHLHEVDLDQPTTFYLFSDGFQDQFGGPDQNKFMVKRLRKLLHSIHDRPMAEQHGVLTNTIENWMAEGDTEQIDDVLLIGMRVGEELRVKS